MKKVILRIWSTLCLLIMSASACAAAGVQESVAPAEPFEIVWYAFRGIPGPDAPVPALADDLLGRKLGFPVHIKLIGGLGQGEGFQQILGMLAANNAPDVYMPYGGAGYLPDFLDSAAAKFSRDELRTYMPQMNGFLVELMDRLDLDQEYTWNYHSDPRDGLLWGVPRTWDLGWVPSGQMWREDLVEELGYEIPETIDEAEQVFSAYKARYPDSYPVSGRGKTQWQCFDIVLNAYGLSLAWPVERNGTMKESFATRDFRAALLVLERWYSAGYWDPGFINYGDELYKNFTDGRYLVLAWLSRADWDYNEGGELQQLVGMREKHPEARVGAYTQLAKNEHSKPSTAVFNPMLGQLTIFGKHVGNDRDRLHTMMQVGDLVAFDREVKLLTGYGIEGVHYTIPKGEIVPTPTDLVSSVSLSEQMDRFGFGFCWQGMFSTHTWLGRHEQDVIDRFVLSPDGPYHSSKVDYLTYPLGDVRDENGDAFRVPLDPSPFDVAIAVMTGQQPIEYYDEWLDRYYDSGGREWEAAATKLYLGK